MTLSPAEWHARFTQQAGWSAALRRYLLQRAGLPCAHRVLEVGCGTGAVLADLTQMVQPLSPPIHGGVGGPKFFGLDLNRPFLALAGETAPAAALTCADGANLPYPAATFDISYCHYLLLWVPDPRSLLAEMRRVTRPGGAVLALAEPDYGARIDYPTDLVPLGRLQTQSLRKQGADPEIGRRLAAIFHQCGLQDVESGVLGAQWVGPPDPPTQALEWDLLRHDLPDELPPTEWARLQAIDSQAWRQGNRILYVPTFYTWGLVP
jgi:ubiquinone/menaquinone biosynthesis C-methylase UbiE